MNSSNKIFYLVHLITTKKPTKGGRFSGGEDEALQSPLPDRDSCADDSPFLVIFNISESFMLVTILAWLEWSSKSLTI